MFSEQTALILMVCGAAVAAIGYLWLVVRAFGVSTGWGIASLIPPLGLLFALLHLKKAAWPVLVMLAGGALAAAAPVTNLISPPKVQDTGVTQIVPGTAEQKGEERLTLTGAKRSEYEVLRTKKSFAVVQWANSDVTDSDVELLRDSTELRELDLNGTQITDQSLAILAALPRLETLRLARTKITDEGFKSHLMPLTRLKELDLTGTAVKGPTARDWKAANTERKLLR